MKNGFLKGLCRPVAALAVGSVCCWTQDAVPGSDPLYVSVNGMIIIEAESAPLNGSW